MAESFNSLYMRDPEAAARQRRAAQAQALMRAGSDTSSLQGTGNNSMQALARVLQGALGGYMTMRADGEAKTAGEAAKAAERERGQRIAFALGLPYTPPGAGAPQAGSPMTENLGGAPNAPAPAPVPAVQQGPLGADTFALQRQQESGGNPNARNPRSSATGADQFINGTWMDYARANPDRFQGMSEDQILARRTDPEESGRATQWYAGQNGRALTGAGLPAGPGELTLAHRFGPAGAQAALRADPNAPAGQVFGEQVMRANPDLAGRTVGQVVGQYQSRYGGGSPQAPMAAALAAPQQAPQSSGRSPAALRQSAALLLQGGSQEERAAAQMLWSQADAIERDQGQQAARLDARQFRQEEMATRRGERLEDRAWQDRTRQEDIARRQAEREADLARQGLPTGYRPGPNGEAVRIEGLPEPVNPATQATEAERKAASYLERMQGAEGLLQGMVQDGYDPGNTRDRVAGYVPFAGNFLTSEKGQQYLNAAAEWARAKLRLESGAVIGDEEAKAEARTYFPMPGDSPATAAQKQRLRDTAVSAIRRQAGRAGADLPASPPGAAPAAAAGAPPPPPGFTVVQ